MPKNLPEAIMSLLACILVACGAAWEPVKPQPQRTVLGVELLDVGQGSAMLLRRAGHAMLVDAGPDSMGLVDSLRSRGIDSLDWVLLSHGHRDHCGGLWETIGQVKIGRIFLGFDTTSPWGADSVRFLARRAGIAVDTLVRGDTLPGLGPWRARILWPPATRRVGDNGASLVVRLGDEAASVLYPGDIGFPEEAELLALEPDLRATVLVVAHHGSAESSSLGFVGRVSPELAVISVGKGNPWGHPRSETLERLLAVLPDSGRLWRTDRDGTVKVELAAGFGALLPKRDP